MSKKSQHDRAERAAAVLREQQQRERRRQVLTVIGVVVVLVVIVGAGFLVNSLRDSSDEVADKAAPAGAGEFGVTIGPADAPHTVIIYEDFLCPFCAELEVATQAGLAELAEQGDVLVDYRPFNLLGTSYSLASASAFKVVLDEAGPEVAKEFHDLLFADQPAESGPYPGNDWLLDKAVEAGADEDQVRAGIENGEGNDWVAEVTQAAEQAGVQGTPTILLDGEVFTDGRTIDDLAANLLAAVE